MNSKLDPKIEVNAALEVYKNNQASLGAALGISRSSVNTWVSSGREYLPELQAHRFCLLNPDYLHETESS